MSVQPTVQSVWTDIYHQSEFSETKTVFDLTMFPFQVVKECKKNSKKKGKDKGGENEEGSPRNKSKKEEWSKEFAEHFAKHCKPSLPRIKALNEKEIMQVCQEIVKVEVLRRSDGAALMWEDAE